MPTKMTNDNRRQILIDIAYRHIAERGIEGLRIRTVAAEARMNHATLLHYFHTKEELIKAVVENLLTQFQTDVSGQAASIAADPTPASRMRAELQDIGCRLKRSPEMFAVLIELTMRARRDPLVRTYLDALDDRWKEHWVSIVKEGIEQSYFRKDIHAEAVVETMMSQIKGLGMQCQRMDSAGIDRLISQFCDLLQNWLSPSRAKQKDS